MYIIHHKNVYTSSQEAHLNTHKTHKRTFYHRLATQDTRARMHTVLHVRPTCACTLISHTQHTEGKPSGHDHTRKQNETAWMRTSLAWSTVGGDSRGAPADAILARQTTCGWSACVGNCWAPSTTQNRTEIHRHDF